MLLYLVYTNDSTRVFDVESAVAKFLTTEKLNHKDISKYKVTTFEASVKAVSTGTELLKNYSSTLVRDKKLDIMLGDEYAQNVQRLKNLIEEFGKDIPQKTNFLSKLEITPFVKNSISKLLTGHSNYILYEFPIGLKNSVEYYKLVLKLHKFRKIDTKFVRELYNKSGYLHSRALCVTPERLVESFGQAKSV